jgi:hypothetical protein
MITQRTDHVAQGLSLLIGQYKNKPNLAAYETPFLTQIQELEDVLFDILSMLLSRETQVGEQLDLIGRLVGQEREGRSDADYRIWIQVRLFINRSSGLPEDLYKVLDLALDNDFVYTENPPASFNISFSDALTLDPPQVALLVKETRSAGVGASVIYTTVDDDETFTFASGDVIEIDAARGFSNIGFCAVGRKTGIRTYMVEGMANEDWTERTNGPLDETARAVAVGPDDMVAVGLNGYVIVSQDGVNWSLSTGMGTTSMYGVTYGAGVFVAVGAGGAIFTSPDGVAWTAQSGPAATQLNAVAYDATLGLFCACGDSGVTDAYLITSPDGVNWTEQTNPSNTILRGIASNGLGLFTAAGYTSGGDTYIITSPDGINWTERANPANNICFAMTYGDGQWVGVGGITGAGYALIITSPDAITWTVQTNPKNLNLNAVTHAFDRFVAVGSIDGDAYTIYSFNGISWVEKANPANFLLYGVTPMLFFGGGHLADVLSS